jgi:hypothetical protein
MKLVALAVGGEELDDQDEERQMQQRPHHLATDKSAEIEPEDRQIGESEQVQGPIRKPARRIGGGAAHSRFDRP